MRLEDGNDDEWTIGYRLDQRFVKNNRDPENTK